MKSESENLKPNSKRAEITCRAELAMLDLWIEKYPNETAEKLRKYRARQSANHTPLQKEKSL